MEYLIGVVLAPVFCAFAMLVGFDRERVFYPAILITVTTYYVLFAAMGRSTPALMIESAASGAFVVLAAVGFRKNLWLVAAGLVGHGVFDFFHHLLIENPGMPAWWPGFCGSFDVLAGIFLAGLLVRRPWLTVASPDFFQRPL